MQIVIVHAARNNELLCRSLPYIKKNILHTSIVIITERMNMDCLRDCELDDIQLYDEGSIIQGLSLEMVKRRLVECAVEEARAGWYFQQFLKMAWAEVNTCEDWYLVWDSDTFPLCPIRLFDDSGHPFYSAKTEFNKTYFQTLKALLDIDRMSDCSFIAEHMTFSKVVMRELVKEILANKNLKGESFFDKILYAVGQSDDPYRAFSEFETYGNFVMARYPGLYARIDRKSSRKGARRFGLKPDMPDLLRLARKFEIVSFERWDRIVLPLIAANKALSRIWYSLSRKAKA